MSDRQNMRFARLDTAQPTDRRYDPRARAVAAQVLAELKEEGIYDREPRPVVCKEFRRRTRAYLAYLKGRHDLR